jgi:chromosome segregation protein
MPRLRSAPRLRRGRPLLDRRDGARTGPGSLADHVRECPPELAARLALVHVADDDDLPRARPGEWLVTRAGRLRRWDGFVASAKARPKRRGSKPRTAFAELSRAARPARARRRRPRQCKSVQAELAKLQTDVIASERAAAAAADAERAALRALDQAEDARARFARARASWTPPRHDLAEQREQAEAERAGPKERRARCPIPRPAAPCSRRPRPSTRRAPVAPGRHWRRSRRTTRRSPSHASAPRRSARTFKAWQARAGDAAGRLAEMARRLEEIEEERAVVAAKPAALMREIEAGDAVRARVAAELAAAEEAVATASEAARSADEALSAIGEALATARETRAGAAARAENEEQRRAEMGRLSGERFQCPPPLLPGRFEFDAADIAAADEESAAMDRLTAERERIGPVNLVAADELAAAEGKHATSLAEQAELTEAVHRLRGSIGSLNREGRERLRAAFEAVDTHFRRCSRACSKAAGALSRWSIRTIRSRPASRSTPSRRASGCSR